MNGYLASMATNNFRRDSFVTSNLFINRLLWIILFRVLKSASNKRIALNFSVLIFPGDFSNMIEVLFFHY